MRTHHCPYCGGRHKAHGRRKHLQCPHCGAGFLSSLKSAAMKAVSSPIVQSLAKAAAPLAKAAAQKYAPGLVNSIEKIVAHPVSQKLLPVAKSAFANPKAALGAVRSAIANPKAALSSALAHPLGQAALGHVKSAALAHPLGHAALGHAKSALAHPLGQVAHAALAHPLGKTALGSLRSRVGMGHESAYRHMRSGGRGKAKAAEALINLFSAIGKDKKPPPPPRARFAAVRAHAPQHSARAVHHVGRGRTRPPTAHSLAVSRVMREHGMKLPDASRYVKEHGLAHMH
jgi:hypothetical protein